ncbi:MAG: xylulokinase, partial [Anaerolineae bacterium]|nr:xylulokinase [Anaerolineae bacterium]
ILSADGRVLAVAGQETTVETPHPGWAEQTPESWVRAVVATLQRALADAGIAPASVVGLSFSGQMHGTVCLGTGGQPLRPAIIWADQRSGAQVDDLVARLGKARLAAWTGNPPATGFMLASWLWLRQHEPETAHATARLLLPKDYVRYRLTDEIGTEPSDASSTSMFNPALRAWSLPLLDELELERVVLPEVFDSAAVAGGLLPGIAAEVGLPAGTPVVFGGSDQAVQALGNGVVAPGVVSSTIGTGGQLFAPTRGCVVDPELRMHSFCHVRQDLWHVETAMLSAGLSLRWLRDQVFDGMTYGGMADAAAGVDAGADGLLFQPYLAGERTPHMDPRARGSFIGLTRRHGRAHLIRAVMEGVVFGMRQGLDVMVALGVPVDAIIGSGGATRHPLWMQLQADIYSRPIRRTRTTEAAAVGAAMLAGIGTGVFDDAQDAISRVVRRHDGVVLPESARVDVYARQYEAFRALYPALVETVHSLGKFGV